MDIVNSKSQDPIMLFNGKPLHSTIDPKKEGDRFFREQEAFFSQKGEKLLIIGGFGLGYSLCGFLKEESLLKNLKIWVICTKELQEKDVFSEYSPLKEIKSLSVSFFNPLLLDELSLFKRELEKYDYSQVLFSLNQNILRHTFSFYEKGIKIVQQIMKENLFNRITDSVFGKRWWHNFILNYLNHPIVSSSFKEIPQEILVLGSGYSSFTNIEKISRNKERFFIISALPLVDFLLSHSIIPDMVVITDGGQANRYYSFIEKLNEHKKSVVVAYMHVYPQLLRWYKGKVLWVNSSLELEEALTPELLTIPSRGSVASTMLSLATLLNRNIYYSGLDFNYTAYHPHFPGASLELAYLYQESYRYNLLESVLAKKVYQGEVLLNGFPSSMSMKAYADDFQGSLKKLKSESFVIQPFSKELDLLQTSKTVKNNPVPWYQESISISPQNKKERLLELLKMMEDSYAKENWASPLIKMLLSKSLLKKEDSKQALKEEIDWLNSQMKHYFVEE